MKRLIKVIAALGVILLFCCKSVLYTNEQVIDRYKTKQEVTKRFGMPTEKKTGDTTEQWLYAYEQSNSVSQPGAKHSNIQTAIVTEFNRPRHFLLFTFDKGGNVTRADFNKVNLEEKRIDGGKTAFAVLIGLGVGLVLFLAAVFSGAFR